MFRFNIRLLDIISKSIKTAQFSLIPSTKCNLFIQRQIQTSNYFFTKKDTLIDAIKPITKIIDTQTKVITLNSPTIIKKELRKAKQDKTESKEKESSKDVYKPENKDKIKKTKNVAKSSTKTSKDVKQLLKTLKKPKAANKAIIKGLGIKPALTGVSETIFKTSKIKFSFNDRPAVVYTDGACSSNGQTIASAGIGVYWGPNHPLNVSKKLEGSQTNNRAEIIAAVTSIEQAIEHKASELTLHTDSKYMISCATEWIKDWKVFGWKTSSKKPVKNMKDLMRLDLLCSKIKIKWEYVPGHQGIHGNEEADKLARNAIERY